LSGCDRYGDITHTHNRARGGYRLRDMRPVSQHLVPSIGGYSRRSAGTLACGINAARVFLSANGPIWFRLAPLEASRPGRHRKHCAPTLSALAPSNVVIPQQGFASVDLPIHDAQRVDCRNGACHVRRRADLECSPQACSRRRRHRSRHGAGHLQGRFHRLQNADV